MHEAIHVGDRLSVSIPRNNFEFLSAPSYQFLAGGIGITPLLPMIRAAESSGADWRLVYGGRNLDSMAFRDELSEYGDRVVVVPQDTHGIVDLATVLGELDRSTLVYGCGPAPMLQALEDNMADWPVGRLQVERFSPKEQVTATNVPFVVRFALSEVEATIPADRSILSVAEELRLPVESSCREGTCGTCETYIVSGCVEHRDSILTQAERDANESMFICVSRSLGGTPLELEL
jgi:ferredoxin-NADP reductase